MVRSVMECGQKIMDFSDAIFLLNMIENLVIQIFVEHLSGIIID